MESMLIKKKCDEHKCYMMRMNDTTLCPRCEIRKLDQQWAVLPEQDEIVKILSNYYTLSNALADIIEKTGE